MGIVCEKYCDQSLLVSSNQNLKLTSYRGRIYRFGEGNRASEIRYHFGESNLSKKETLNLMTAMQRIISEAEPMMQKKLEEVENQASLSMMIMVAFELGRMFMVMLVEEILAKRAKEKTKWPNCKKCGRRLQSKGFAERQIQSILGTIRWERRIGRCAKGCKIEQVAPLDKQLGIEPYEQTSKELKKIAISIAVFVAYETAANLMKQIIGIEVSSGTIWQWVQVAGKQEMQRLEAEILKMNEGEHREKILV